MGLLNRSTFEPHPEGITIGTLADVQFDENGKFGPQIKWVLDTEELMQDGRPFRVFYWTAPTLNEKSNLYKLLKAFGEDPDDEAWDGVEDVSDFENLLGRRVTLNIVHKKGENGPQARIDTVLPVKKPKPGAPRQQPLEDREPVGAGARGGGNDPRWAERED